MAREKKKSPANGNGANLGFEATLWAAADKMRNNMDAAEYKHVVLGLIFLKYISDAFEAKHAELDAQKADGADPEDHEAVAGHRTHHIENRAGTSLPATAWLAGRLCTRRPDPWVLEIP